MNQGKIGEPYHHYPESFVQLLGYMRAYYFHLPFRQTEGGVVKAHAKSIPSSIPDYSTISRRVNKLDIKINERVGNDIVIALDSTGGIKKVSNRGGEWMRHRWNVKRGYLKIHVVAVVDIRKKKVVSLVVTSEEVHDDSKVLEKLVKGASENNDANMVIADDGAYDSKKNFRYLSI